MGDQAGPSTTIPPFANTQILPACAAGCGPLYDANGACVPPAVNPEVGATAFTACFCADPRVGAFSSGNGGVCDEACTATQALASIGNWFRSMCDVTTGGNTQGSSTTNNGQSTGTTGSTASTGTGGSSSGSNSGGNGGDWLSNHWQWVVFIVVMVVGIAGIWIGACIWRRRYLRKKDRQSHLGQKHSGSASRPSWGPGMDSGNVAGQPFDPAAYDSNRDSNGILLSNTGGFEEKKPKEKKRWIVGDRT